MCIDLHELPYLPRLQGIPDIPEVPNLVPRPAPARQPVVNAPASGQPAQQPVLQPGGAPAQPSVPADNLGMQGVPFSMFGAPSGGAQAPSGGTGIFFCFFPINFISGRSAAPSGGAPGAPGAPGGAGGPLDFLRNDPQFQQLRQMVQQDPNLLQPIIQSLARSNPALLQRISENQAEFLRIMSEPATGAPTGAPSGAPGSGDAPMAPR